MRISYHAGISMILGVMIGIFAPLDIFGFSKTWSSISDSLLVIWRYLVYPYLFFSLTVAVAQLKRDRRLSTVFLLNISLIIGLSVLFSLIGTFLGAILPIQRIPIQLEKIFMEPPISQTSFLDSILPMNALSIFSKPFLLPLVIFAIILGLNFSFEREVTEPSYNFFDSLSRIFYHIFDRIIQFSWIPVFFFTIDILLKLRERELINYSNFLWVTFLSTILCVLITITFLCYFFIKHKNSFFFLNHIMQYLPLTLFCPNIQLNGCIASYYSHKKLSIKRDIGGIGAPLFILFGKAGSIFVCSMSMITILRSYSSLNLNFSQLLMVCSSTFFASFLTSHRPENVFLIMLPNACTIYGKPLITGAHILDPVMNYLVFLSSFIDAVMILFSIVFVGNLKKLLPNKNYADHVENMKLR